MTVPTEDSSQLWTPQPLPEDDVLAREPAPEDVALVAAATEPAPVDEPAAVPAEEPETATNDAPGATHVTDVTDAPGTTRLEAGAAPAATPLPDDADLPPSVQLLQPGDAAAGEDQRGWAAALVGIVIALFFVFAPVQVVAGDAVLWALVYGVGGLLTLVGGFATGRTALTRGTARPVPLTLFVLGVLIILGCVVATVVGARAVAS